MTAALAKDGEAPALAKVELSSRQLAERGWSGGLAAGVSAALVFLALSGLWIYLGPFSVGAQLLVLVHTLVGLALVVPYLRYQIRHLLTWVRQRATDTQVLGYALALAVVVSIVSGLVVTWQSAAGPRLSATWDLVHLVSGLAALGLLVVHLALAFMRRRQGLRADAALAFAMRRFFRRMLAGLTATAAAVVLVALVWPRQLDRLPVPPGYSLPEHAQRYEEYRGNPFAPTFARTDDLQLIRPEVLAHSAACGSSGCHEQILAEWEPGAHRFSAMNQPFQAVQHLFARQREPAETRYCAGCHDPISLFAGAKDIANQSLSAPGVDEGISCSACHSIARVDQRGNADYVLAAPRKYLWEHAKGGRKWVSDFLIRAFPRQHLADYDRPVLRTPELCGACHKQFIPEALNRFGLVASQNQYDEWKNSHWHSGDVDVDLACRDCHMRLVRDSSDPGHGEAGDARRGEQDGAHRHHGFIATNNFMPAVLRLPNWEQQVRLTEEWVRGETVLPEIADVWPTGPVAGLEIVAPAVVAAGEEITVRVLVVNRKAGHNFITGPLDFIRSWVHLRALDASGTVIAEWGSIDPASRDIEDEPGRRHVIGNKRDQGTLVLEALPVDERGEILQRHELWKSAGATGKRVIFPTYSDAHQYRLRLPEGFAGEVRLEADLNYRRYRQEFLDLVVPDLEQASGVFQPTVVQASAARGLRVEGSPAGGGAARSGG